jgi:Transglycosylase
MYVNERSSNRRWVMLGATSAGLCAALMIAVFVIYPRVGEAKLAEELTEAGAKVGRTVKTESIEVGFGWAKIRGLVVSGPEDGAAPLLRIDQITVKFRGWSAMAGKVAIDRVEVTGVAAAVRRDARGVDNFSDLMERFRGGDGQAPGAGGGRSRGLRPKVAKLSGARVTLEDERTGLRAQIADLSGQWSSGDITGLVSGVEANAATGQKLRFGTISLKKGRATRALIELAAGEVELWPKMSLSGISGTVIPEGDPGHYRLSVDGGYGGVAGKLWKALGEIDVVRGTASLELAADKFNLDRLEPILAGSYLVDYAKTSVDANLRVDVVRSDVTFSGAVHVHDLSVGHPMLADREVHNLDFEGTVAGTVQRDRRIATLTRGDFVARGLPFSVTGEVAMRGGSDVVPPVAGSTETALVERAEPRVAGHLVIPPIACQAVLDSIPPEMVPYMQGYKMKGIFSTDLRLEIDFAKLDDVVLDGSVGIKNCKVKEQPEASPKRLLEPFEHFVEVEKDQWISFMVGPDNPDFVPYEDISPNLVNSIMTTEDSSFMKHHGFIVSEFRSALIKNLKAGYFRYGASSITMQLVKNVLLYREKTLSRKLQELFLTWDIENTLEKERILEIYFNVIEYGPGLYGIGPATQHFFGKTPKELTPVEAAFFSSILPAPKQRYQQYCKGTLTQWTSDKIERILGLMFKRGRLTEEEYQAALVTPLSFVRDGSETEKECLDRRARAIKKARPTNPMKQ